MRYPTSKEILRAPQAQFRVVAVDLADSSATYLVGDYPSFEAANEAASGRAGMGAPVYIYDDRGEMLLRFGSWH